MTAPHFCRQTLSAQTVGLLRVVCWLAVAANLIGAPALVAAEADTAYRFEADSVMARRQDSLHLDGKVKLSQGDWRLFADRIDYLAIDDIWHASGHVLVEKPDASIKAERGEIRGVDQVGTFYRGEARFGLATPSAQSDSAKSPERKLSERFARSETILSEGDGRYTLLSGWYTTCRANDVDWYLKAKRISLDIPKNHGEASSAALVFKDTTILASPFFSFPIDDNGKHSGFLPPLFGTSSTPAEGGGTTAGIDIAIPYLWDIAPNYDLTITPRLLQNRGVQFGATYRYLQQHYHGEWRGEWLPHDRVFGESRGAFKALHEEDFGRGWSGKLLWHEVGDNRYFTDLASRIGETSQTNLPREVSLHYQSPSWWQWGFRYLAYQTLQPNPDNPVAVPYRLAPEIIWQGKRYDLFAATDWDVQLQSSSFRRAGGVEGDRQVLQSSLSLPLSGVYWRLEPKVALHASAYQLDHQDTGVAERQQRFLPITSLDAQLFFDRDATFAGKSYLQTLEPRLYYVYIPYRAQQSIPLFDSAYTDFNFAQMFTENRFSGQDRVGDANQLTAALTTRVIDQNSGAEWLRAAIGARYAFVQPKVSLASEQPPSAGATNILALLSTKLISNTILDLAADIDPNKHQNERTSIGGRWQPSPNYTLSVNYRRQTQALSQLDIAGQWQVGSRWSLVGRYNYSFRDKVVLESIAGVEYQAGCWVARAVAHRLQTASGQPSINYFLQLELNDFAKIGSNPLQLLRRSVPGYRPAGVSLGATDDNIDNAW